MMNRSIGKHKPSWAVPRFAALLCGQGIARHSEAEIMELLADGLASLSVLLGGQKFFLGSAPCAADASAFGFLDKCAPSRQLPSAMHTCCSM